METAQWPIFFWIFWFVHRSTFFIIFCCFYISGKYWRIWETYNATDCIICSKGFYEDTPQQYGWVYYDSETGEFEGDSSLKIEGTTWRSNETKLIDFQRQPWVSPQRLR